MNSFYNRYFDTFVQPQLRLGRWELPAFQAFGYVGLALSVLFSIGLTIYQGLSMVVMGLIVIAAILSFYVVAYATKIITGREQLIYYHHEVAVIVFTASVVWLSGQPLLGYLDATIVGLGIFLACGRIGCLMVGCCHGRPHRWGVCYTDKHADAGFSDHYVGVRLFPIQAVESLWVVAIVAGGVAMVLNRQPPGSAFVWYIIAYDLGRFVFEFARGDEGRPYYWHFSEAQWISLLLTITVTSLGLMGILPFHLWHIGASASIMVIMLLVAGWRRNQDIPYHQVFDPRHMAELARAISPSPALWSGDVFVSQTSLGMRLSASVIGNSTYLYTFSGLPFTTGIISKLTRLIFQLGRHSGESHLVRGSNGVFHLVIEDEVALWREKDNQPALQAPLPPPRRIFDQANALARVPTWAQRKPAPYPATELSSLYEAPEHHSDIRSADMDERHVLKSSDRVRVEIDQERDPPSDASSQL